MNKIYGFIVAITIQLILTLSSYSYSQDKISVAVSILPQVEFVKSVGGDYVDILEMVPPNSSPESYEPTPGQMKQLSHAKAYFKIGTNLDFEINLMGKMISINPQLLIVDCSKGINQLAISETEKAEGAHDGHYHGLNDPHIWNSLRNASIMIDNIAEGLIVVDSSHKAIYLENAASYKAKLDSLDIAIIAMFQDISRRDFIVLHPAWGYFARDYNLVELSIEAEGKEPSAAEIKKLVDLARAQQIRTVFASPQFNSESAKVIAREINGAVEYIDPLNGQFLDNMRLTAIRIANSIK